MTKKIQILGHHYIRPPEILYLLFRTIWDSSPWYRTPPGKTTRKCAVIARRVINVVVVCADPLVRRSGSIGPAAAPRRSTGRASSGSHRPPTSSRSLLLKEQLHKITFLTRDIVHWLIRARWAKLVVITYIRTFSGPFLGSRHCTCHHLTQPAGLASLNPSTVSMSLYGHATGTAVEGGFNCKQWRWALPI